MSKRTMAEKLDEMASWVKNEELQLGHIENFVQDYNTLKVLLECAVSKSRKIDDIYETLVKQTGVEMPSNLAEIKETGFWTISFNSITTEIEVGKLQLSEYFNGSVAIVEDDEEDWDIEVFEDIDIVVAKLFLENSKG